MVSPVVIAAQVALLVYIAAIFGYGIYGYWKEKSQMSLWAGIIASCILGAGFILAWFLDSTGLGISFGMALILSVFFGARWWLQENRPLIPHGLLCVVSTLMSIFLLVALIVSVVD